jgi:sialidase-1
VNKITKYSVFLPAFVLLTLLNIQTLISRDNGIDLWQNGTGDYNNYRIPALIVTQKGTLLAFCEGREGGDSGDINILLKRSFDNGKSWSKEQIVWDDKLNTCGNPCPVIDRESGRIWLFLTWNSGSDNEGKIINKESDSTRKPFLCYSDDDGKSWSKPVDLSATCKLPSWGWYATGPGIGIQLTSQKYKNRIVIPANHSYDDPKGEIHGGPYSYGSHVLLSDNGGKSWRKSQSIRPGCSESQVVELTDGTLLMNIRSYNDKHSRAISKSHDGGETWSEIQHAQQLVESRCQAGMLDFGLYNGKNIKLFSNPSVPNGRTHMTIKVSFDNCVSWTNSKLIYAGPSAYSCMAKLPNGNIGLFFEYGENERYDRVRFVSFAPKELFTAGALIEKK